MIFYGRIRIRRKGSDPTESGSATLILPIPKNLPTEIFILFLFIII